MPSSFNLPDDVFEAGEKKPQKKSSAKNGKKREASEVIQPRRLRHSASKPDVYESPPVLFEET